MVNPDVVHARKFIAIADELIGFVDLDWSTLHAQDDDTIRELRDVVIKEFVGMPPALLKNTCPVFVEYMLENQRIQDWQSIAIAIDNANGMYHPLRLTKVMAFHR